MEQGEELVLRIVLRFIYLRAGNGTGQKIMTTILQIMPDMAPLMEQATRTQPGDNSGYMLATTLLATGLLGSWAIIISLYRKIDTLQKDMLTKVEAMATENTKLLASVASFFEKITTDLSNLSPEIVREAEACSARLKEHMNQVGRKIQKNEEISTDNVYPK